MSVTISLRDSQVAWLRCELERLSGAEAEATRTSLTVG
jgi:hypothetical protein